MRHLCFFRLLPLLLLLAALLSGCCADNTCDCQDELEDAIQLRFNARDTTGVSPRGFRLAELDTIRLVRYRVTSTATDTVVLTRRKADADKVLNIANNSPFGLNGSLRTNSYRYAVLLTSGPRRAPRVRQRYELRAINLDGRLRADGCCTCYENTAKTAALLVSPAGSNQTASSATPVNLKQVIELQRP